MQDLETDLLEYCSELVSLKKYEAFPRQLLTCRRAGEWVPVRQLREQTGLGFEEPKPELVAVWLNDPFGNTDYVVMVFYDDDSKWSFAAHYNRQRLLGT